MDTDPLPSPSVIDFDKFVHVIMFLGLSGIIFFDSTGYLRYPISKMRIFLGIFLFPTALGGIIEVMQELFTVTRTGEWLDFLFDGVGAACGWIVALLINSLFLLKKKI